MYVLRLQCAEVSLTPLRPQASDAIPSETVVLAEMVRAGPESHKVDLLRWTTAHVREARGLLRLALRLCLACIGTELQRWMMISSILFCVGTLLVHDALAIKCGYMSMQCQRMAVRAAVPVDSRDLVVRYVDVRC